MSATSAVPPTSLSQSAATTTTLKNSGGAPDVVVAGQSAPSVTVQSQMATSTVDGKGTTKSNLVQVVQDLSAVHSAHNGWAEAESKKIDEWGKGEIARLMSQTKGVEQRLVSEAQQQQRLLEEAHKVELAQLVQQLDANKAKKLKELEDGLQRQIQAALNSTKQDINRVESEMNNRKMQLLQQQQMRAAKDVDRLSNLAVEAKLVPSTTRTVIETNTETGTVIAVASGGEITTGQANSQSISSAHVEAVPTAGVLTQATDVKTGDIVTNKTNRKVGTGAIVDTVTQVTQGPDAAQPIGGTMATTSVAPAIPPRPLDSSAIGTANSGNITSNVTANAPQTGGAKHIDAAYGKPLEHPVGGSTTKASSDLHDKTTEPAHKESTLQKIKHAITGEPRSSDATKTKH